ncbi:hypothetical protein ACOSP7_023132 [Xanthoceras sorbifolium]
MVDTIQAAIKIEKSLSKPTQPPPTRYKNYKSPSPYYNQFYQSPPPADANYSPTPYPDDYSYTPSYHNILLPAHPVNNTIPHNPTLLYCLLLRIKPSHHLRIKPSYHNLVLITIALLLITIVLTNETFNSSPNPYPNLQVHMTNLEETSA